jgi:hypothetical protein
MRSAYNPSIFISYDNIITFCFASFFFTQYKLLSKVKAAGFSSTQMSLHGKTSQKSTEGCHFNKNDTFLITFKILLQQIIAVIRRLQLLRIYLAISFFMKVICLLSVFGNFQNRNKSC